MDDALPGILPAGPWQLTSETSFDTSGKVTNRYIGTKADSVLFLYGYDQYWNVVPTNISSYIRSSNRIMAYSYPLEAPGSFQKRVGTIALSPPWKDGFSDTLFVTYYANYSAVFMAKDSVHGGYEIDSLKRIDIK